MTPGEMAETDSLPEWFSPSEWCMLLVFAGQIPPSATSLSTYRLYGGDLKWVNIQFQYAFTADVVVTRIETFRMVDGDILDMIEEWMPGPRSYQAGDVLTVNRQWEPKEEE